MKAEWQQTTLKELCVVDWGNTNLTKSSYTEGGKFLAVSAAGCDGRIAHFEHLKHTPVLSAIGAQCGKMFFPLEDFTAIKNTITLTPRSGKSVGKFLYYLFTLIDLPKRGAGQPFISKGDIEKFSVSFPQIAEQERIVSILDEAFEGIDTAVANAEKNLANARELFDNHLSAVVSEMWTSCEVVSLSDLATDITDGDHLPPPKAETGIPFITIGNINKKTRTVDFADTFMVNQEYFDDLKANRKPRKGDVLYTVTGSFGIPVIIQDDAKFCFQRHIGLVRPKAETNSDWLYYLLLSPQVFRQAGEGATGTAQKTVSLKVLRGIKAPRVPPSRQRSVVAALDVLAKETARLEGIYQLKLDALTALKQAILQKAFAAELTARSGEAVQEAAE